MSYIKMYPSFNGDAFLIKESGPAPTILLIDGGFSTTFQNCILPDLKKLHTEGESLDLVVATHIDSDHIAGLIKFFEQNGSSMNPSIIKVNEVWHNSLRSIKNHKSQSEELLAADQELITEICRLGLSTNPLNLNDHEEISSKQGSSLGAVLLKNGYKWNEKEGFCSINCQSYSCYNISPNVSIRVLAPTKERLAQLHDYWLSDLQSLGFASQISDSPIFDDAFEFLCSMKTQSTQEEEHIELCSSDEKSLDEIYSPDQSITNGSSISMIVEMGKSKLLFLGDSWAEDIIEALKSLKDQEFPIIFDAIKISHHGSCRSTSPDLLRIIDSPVFLVSSNGQKRGHPSEELIKAILDRSATFPRKIYFNYSTSTSQKISKHICKSNSTFSIHENAINWIKIGAANND